METLKQYWKSILEKREKDIAEGNIMNVNEVTANLMLGSMIIIILLLMALCWGLNELGVFTADKALMRYAVIFTLIEEIPVLTISRVTKSEPKWLKYVLAYGLVFMCANMCAVLTHNVTLLIVIPVVLSVRYCNEKFTTRIAAVSAAAMLISTVASVHFGIENLNVFIIPEGEAVTVSGRLRAALSGVNYDELTYLKSLAINDLLPRYIIFSVIAVACVRVAKYGKEMIDLQTESSKKTGRIETELNLATRIQTSMLPCIFPAFPDHEQLELFAKNIPAKEVGGDFYDYFMIDEDHVVLVMADVSGKGVGAALFMTISKIVIKNQLLLGLDPATALTNANRQLCENNEAGLFVTTWAAVYEVSTGKLKYTNAGHNPPILKKKGEECVYLTDRHGLVLAGYDGVKYRQSEITLSEGDEIFLYTDGVTEATDSDNELYGEDRLISMMGKVTEESVESQVTDVLGDINKFVGAAEQFDDITMMGMRILEKHSEK